MRPRRATMLDSRSGGLVLGDDDLAAALVVCAQDPVGSVLAASRIEHALDTRLAGSGGELWGYQHDGELVAICWAGANLVPVVPVVDQRLSSAACDAFALMAERQGRRCSSIVGPAPAVLELWGRLRSSWRGVREVRADQPSMVIDHAPALAPDPRVRRSRDDEFGEVLPACVRMFTEEVGYSPAGSAYEARVRGLITAGRSFVRMEADVPGPVRSHDPSRERVVFKAELGAVAGGVAQVQGVWVAPDRRGNRLSESGMAAVVALARASIAPVVSLYVNAYNARAIAAYEAVGFRTVGSYATVLF